MALEQRDEVGKEVVAWLHGEQDEQRQTSERLRSERGTICGECDLAVWEDDEA